MSEDWGSDRDDATYNGEDEDPTDSEVDEEADCDDHEITGEGQDELNPEQGGLIDQGMYNDGEPEGAVYQLMYDGGEHVCLRPEGGRLEGGFGPPAEGMIKSR